MAKALGSKGGKATLKKHGKSYFKDLRAIGVKKQKLSTKKKKDQQNAQFDERSSLV